MASGQQEHSRELDDAEAGGRKHKNGQQAKCEEDASSHSITQVT